jgi:hypothetical protein
MLGSIQAVTPAEREGIPGALKMRYHFPQI